ncbi:related to Polyketide synthase [Ustilago trichophora]|uniref:Related to Polyketide synthase n=1 Tax=Ustilago trichophora TaxID=86804 RepID=A0A5C3EMW9_9BASI|nr:related to Polyketide synthase [Ustilago trichophora]
MSFDSKFSSFDNVAASTGSESVSYPVASPSPRAPIIIFGSQGSSFLDGFDVILSLSRIHPELAAFLSCALDAVRVELQSVADRHDGTNLPNSQRESEVELLSLLPPFEPFSDLKTLVNFHHRNGLKDPVINGVLLCLLQTAYVVSVCCISRQDDNDPDDLTHRFEAVWTAISQPCSHLLGFCTGALSAFTIRPLVENRVNDPAISIWAYAQEAVKAIRICFWISLRSAQARLRLTGTQGCDTSSDPWSIVIAVKDPDYVEKVYLRLSKLNELDQQRPLDKPVSLVVTARAIGQISIGGPPRQLERFKAYLIEHLGVKCRAFPLQIFSPYHSPDLETEASLVMLDLERRGLVDDSSLPPSQKILWETANANILAESSLRGTMRALIGSNLCSIADWDAMIDNLVLLEGELPDAAPLATSTIVSFGPGSNLATDLRKHLSGQSDQPPSIETFKMLDVPALCQKWISSKNTSGPMLPLLPQPDVHGEEVVIVSMACRFPGEVRSPEQLWTCLETGRSTVTEIPKHLFDIDAYYGEGKNQTSARHMHALPENVVKSMDARLFSMSPKEIEQLDPQHRLVMLCSYEALERAGYSPEANSPSCFDGKRIAVCMGASWDDYRENASWNIGSYFITGNIRAFIPGHISFSLKWEGPSVSVDSLECSAVSALQWSRRALLSGQCDVALAGAVNVLTQPQIFIAMDKEGILSRSGTNATFSSKLDGKTRGDGCGVLLLKRRSTALQDGDRILATLSAARTTYHGKATDDEGVAARQSDFLAQVMSEADMCARNLVHIEASGSHSQQVEAIEFDSFARVLANPKVASKMPLNGGISVASSRPNIGAGEAVSAIASVMKAVLILEKGSVPRQISIAHPSLLQPSIAAICESSDLFVPTQAQLLPSSWRETGRTGILVNSLATTGCHGVVLVQAPTTAEVSSSQTLSAVKSPSPGAECAWIFVLSAKTKDSGAMLKKELIDYLQREVCLADLSYTLACRRTHHPFRLSVIASDQDELIKRLRGADFIEAKPAADLPGFGLLFQTLKPSSVHGLEALVNLTWSLRDRYEALTSAIPPSDAHRVTHHQIDLLQICLASLLEDCGVRPAVVSGSMAPALLSGGCIDQQTLFGEHCLSQFITGEHRLKLNVPKEAAKLVTHEGDIVQMSSELSLLHALSESSTIEVEGRGHLPDSYRWIKIGELDASDVVARDPLLVATSEAQSLQRSLLSSLGSLHQQGYTIRWIEYFRPHLHHLQLISELPTYPFHLQQYWMEYHDRNLLQTTVPAQGAVDAGRRSAGLSFGHAQSSGQEQTYDPPTQPLLTLQIAANGASGSGFVDLVFVSELTDEIQTALLKVSTPSAMAIELMAEAAKEASETSTQSTLVSESHLLCLSEVELSSTRKHLTKAHEILLSVREHLSGDTEREGHIDMHLEDRSPLIGTSSYRWLSGEILESRWSRLQEQLEEKIRHIKSDGEMLAGRLVYKNIPGDLANRARSIQRAYVQMPSREVVFCNHTPSHDDAVISDAQCVLPLLLATLEECLRWLLRDLDNESDGEHEIVGIGDIVIRDDWLDELKQTLRSPKDYTALVTQSQHARSIDEPMIGALFDMLLLDGNSRIVGELNRIRLAKSDAGPKKSAPQLDTTSAPHAKSEPNQASSSVPSREPDDPTMLSNASQPSAKKPDQKRRTSRAAGLHAQILGVLASELGIAVEEMKPSVKFADLGLDSLMSLVCMSTLETLNLGFEIPQSLFMECDSPEELLVYIEQQVGEDPPHDDAEDGKEALMPEDSRLSADPSANSNTTSVESPQGPQAAHSVPSNSAIEETMRIIVSTIEMELGVAEGSIDRDANLADLGMDSLMSLLVLGNLSGTLPIELPSSLFMDCTSLREIHAFLKFELAGSSDTAAQPDTAVEQPMSVPAPAPVPVPATCFTIPAPKKPVLIQNGTNAGSKTPLFLLPDGSGMSTVYQFFHAIDRPIYSINSPFLASASTWNSGMSQITQYYLACIKLIQPRGPWLVGGWSFGGMAAFEIAQSLACSPGAATDRIAGLFLLDTPCPALYPPLPMSIVDWIFTAPEVKDIAPPALSPKLVAHFKATVDNLDGWQPSRFQEGDEKTPSVWYIVADHPLPGKIEDVKEVNATVKWLFRANRARESGTDGWDTYIPANKIQVKAVAQANHFTLVREAVQDQIAQILAEACQVALEA